MPTKIRLQRHGKKRYAYYHVVIADSRAPRDGKFIEKLGAYNPNTNPATIDIDFDKTLDWVKKGAQPTDTVRALLSYTGILFKNHLDKGVEKGAFSQEDAEKKFEAWQEEKQGKIDSKKDKLASDSDAESKKRFEAEQETNKKKAATIAAKTAELAGEVVEAASEVAEDIADVVSDVVESVTEVVAEVKDAVSGDTAEDKKEA